MGTMNVGKVSFGSATQAAGATPGAAQQQAPVKKADKGDVVVIGGKEIKKSTLAKGGVLATAIAALGTLAVAAKRGKGLNEAKAAIEKANNGVEGEATKLFQNIKDGFGTFIGKGKEAYKTTLEKAKGLAGAGDKAATETAGAAGDKVTTAAEEGTKKAAEKTEVKAEEVKAEEVKTETKPAAAEAEKTAEKAATGTKLKSEELEQKAQNMQAKLDEQTKKLADLKAEQTTLEKRTNDLPGVIQKRKDDVELSKLELEEARQKGATKKEIKDIKAKLKANEGKLADAEKAQKEVAARKKAVDGQIKGLESQKAVEGRKKLENSISEVQKQAKEAKKAEFLESSEELKKLNDELARLKEKRAGLTGTDEAAVKKQEQYDKAIQNKESKIEKYKEETNKLFDAKEAMEAKAKEIANLQEEIKNAAKADKVALNDQLKALKADYQKLKDAYSNADIALFKMAGGAKKA